MKTFLLLILVSFSAMAQADPHMFLCVQDGRNWQKEMRQDPREKMKREVRADEKNFRTSRDLCKELREVVKEFCESQ